MRRPAARRVVPEACSGEPREPHRRWCNGTTNGARQLPSFRRWRTRAAPLSLRCISSAFRSGARRETRLSFWVMFAMETDQAAASRMCLCHAERRRARGAYLRGHRRERTSSLGRPVRNVIVVIGAGQIDHPRGLGATRPDWRSRPPCRLPLATPARRRGPPGCRTGGAWSASCGRRSPRA